MDPVVQNVIIRKASLGEGLSDETRRSSVTITHATCVPRCFQGIWNVYFKGYVPRGCIPNLCFKLCSEVMFQVMFLGVMF